MAQEEVPAAGVAIPELDVAENVRRMLEASRKEQGEVAVEPVGDGMPAVPVPSIPTAPPPAVATPPAAPSIAASSARPATPAAPPAPPARASDHVPLPEREFTIRSTDDIRELARELEEAKRRQPR
ncbi:MAG: hypothetical protein Kow0096_00360 [Thiohalomonadaceae bacterium]